METFGLTKTWAWLTCASLVATPALAQAQAQAQAQPPAKPRPASSNARVEALQRQLAAQGQQIEALQKQLADQGARVEELQKRVGTEETRTAAPAQAARPPSAIAAVQAARTGSSTAPAPGAAVPAGEQGRPVQVGVAPPANEPTRPVAQLFDEPGILTPAGHYVLEPSFQYSYSSNNRVALVGYTVIPAILIGLIDVREVKRNTMVGALTGRWGLTNKLEVEAKVPYVARSDATVSREVFTGSAQDNVFDTHGNGMGDIELAARYQLFSAHDNWPYMIGGLRFKSRTGTDPFEVVTDCITRCIGNTTGTGLPLDLPTGSGFYSLQPSLTWLYPSDPAVFFGGLSYAYNFGRSDVSRQVINGTEFIGDVKPGDVWGMNFGMGLALNDRASFSLGVELYSVGRTMQNDEPVRGSVRTQLASMLLGYSYRLTDKTSLNVSVGAGLTRDTPDLTMTVRVPVSF